MKKSIILTLAFILLLSPLVHAACQASDSRCLLAEQFGLNESQIPKSSGDIKQLYLQKEWTSVIEKNKILGPIHQSLTRNPWFFVILFARPYELSLIFFVTIVLWFLLSTQIAKIVEASTGMKGVYAFAIGLLGAIILAQVRVIYVISNFLLDLIFKQENWWIRLIIILVIIVVIAIEHRVAKYAEKYIKEQNKAKLTQKQEEQVRRIEKLEQGAGIK